MIYELREYTTVPGRMPALVKRFKEHTLGLFEKHGIEVTFISLTTFGEHTTNELVYVVRFDDMADLERRWAAFQADPDWQQAKAASEADGPIVASIGRRILSPAPFEAR